jgi:hypothetical protein
VPPRWAKQRRSVNVVASRGLEPITLGKSAGAPITAVPGRASA